MRKLRAIPKVFRIEDLLEIINERFRTFNSGDDGAAFSGNMGGARITNLGNPDQMTDAATAGWVLSRIKGGGGVGPQGPPGSTGIVTLSRDATDYSGAIARDIDDVLGEIPSFRSFGAVGDGATNDQPAMQAAVNEISARGGGAILIPAGYTFKVNAALELPADVSLFGQGETSVIFRGAAIADGKGVLHLAGGRNTLRDFLIDGDVTTAVGLQYGVTVPASPGDVVLTKNTSIWIIASDVLIEGVRIRHTGGYAVLLDARTADVDRVDILNCAFRHNRPHKFGTTVGDLEYGSWSGGILGISDGSSFRTASVNVSGCSFARSTGNQIWTWLPAFTELHTDWTVDGCVFSDIGRDCVLLGGIINSVVSNNTARRIGYMVLTDGGASTPKYLVNQWAVAFDTSGLARNCSYVNNTVTSVYGGAFDLDGFSEGVVDGNTARTPVSGEPEYTEDAIATWTTVSYGINLGDTSANTGGDSVLVTNNYFKNMGAGAIRLYAWRRGLCSGNLIDHPTAAAIAPIIYGPGGAAGAQAQGDCVVTANTILYPPAGAAAIVEDATLAAFGGAINHVFGNRIIGSSYEFYKHSSSGSVTSWNLTTATAAAGAVEEMRFQVEGTGSAKALKVYAVAAAVVAQVMSLTKAGFMNVSDNGAASTGNIATGSRTTAAWGDAIHTGKQVASHFYALQDYTDGGFSSSDANALDSGWALWRFNKTTDTVEISVDTLAGARIWIPLIAGGGGGIAVPGSNEQVLFNDSGILGADAGLTYNKTTNVLTVAGGASIAAIVTAAGYIQALEGFLTLDTSSDAINAPNGGVTALSHIAARNDGASGFTLARSSATARTWGFGIDSAGQLFVRDETAAGNRLTFDSTTGRATFAAQVVVGGAASGSGLLVSDGYIESAEGFYSPVASYQAFQAPSGGMYGRSLRATAYAQVGNSFGVPALTAGDSFAAGAIYYNSSSGRLEFFNGSTWQQLDVSGGGVTSVTSFNANLTASPTTGAVILNFSATPTFSSLLATGAISAGGVVASSSGFNYTGFAANGIQAQNGGVTAANINIANGFGGWNPAIDPSRNFYANEYRSTGGLALINSAGQFVGFGVDMRFAGCGAIGYNVWNGSFYEFGQTATRTVALFGGGAATMVFRGGILVQIF